MTRPYGCGCSDVELIDELLPKVRRLNPHWPDDQVLEMAESMAELWLLDEEIG